MPLYFRSDKGTLLRMLEVRIRFLYANDLVQAAQTPSFEEDEERLMEALEALGKFYNENALRSNPSKTQSCAFHLRHRQSNRILNISWQGVTIEHCSHLTLDRSVDL